MRPGVARWDDLPPVDGNLLIIVNSPDEDVAAVEMLFNAVSRLVPKPRIFVIAEPSWSSWLESKGVESTQTLIARDAAGERLDWSYFIETPAATRWAMAHNFTVIVGTAAHSLYNEEIKTVFEERLTPLSPDANVFAHALPSPFFYVLDQAELLERTGREQKVAEYRMTSTALLDGLYRQWESLGRPPRSDEGVVAKSVLAEHIPASWLRYDESGPATIGPRRIPSAVVELHQRLNRRMAEQTQRLDAELERCRQYLLEVQAERHEAVSLRDRLLAEAHAAAQPLHRKITSRLLGRK